MKKIVFLFSLILLLTGCGNKNKAAYEELERAKNLYENSEFASARTILDSLKTQYPDDAKVQRARLDMQKLVESAEISRNMIYIDSLLPIRQAELETILPQFQLEKNAEYEDVGRYIDKAYNPSLERNGQFIKATVNEHGDIALVSVYGGSDIGHTYLKVSDSSGNYTETEVIPRDGGMNYAFKDVMGRSYETITFQNGTDNGVLMFIYNYGDGKLTLQRLGGKKTRPVTISNNEKQSIKRMVDLSVMLKEVDGLKKEKQKSEQRIEYLRAQEKD